MSAIDSFCPVGIGGTKGIDVSRLKIFVGGLNPSQGSKDLFDIFSPFGTIREAVVIPDRFRVRSRCYGFVTFKHSDSVARVFADSPIVTALGQRLSVVLAASNTKPRRAHFAVKHGVSGHKPLPRVAEEQSITPRSRPNQHGMADLFRTANIQPIAPAKLYVDDSPTKTDPVKGQWPNADIKRDYHNLKAVPVDKDKENEDPNQSASSSWRLISVQTESSMKATNEIKKQSTTRSATSLSSRWSQFKSSKNEHRMDSVVDEQDDRRRRWSLHEPPTIRSPTPSLREQEVQCVDESEQLDIPCTGSDIEGVEDTAESMDLMVDLDSVFDEVVSRMEEEMHSLNKAPSTFDLRGGPGAAAIECLDEVSSRSYHDPTFTAQSVSSMQQQPTIHNIAVTGQPLIGHHGYFVLSPSEMNQSMHYEQSAYPLGMDQMVQPQWMTPNGSTYAADYEMVREMQTNTEFSMYSVSNHAAYQQSSYGI